MAKRSCHVPVRGALPLAMLIMAFGHAGCFCIVRFAYSPGASPKLPGFCAFAHLPWSDNQQTVASAAIQICRSQCVFAGRSCNDRSVDGVRRAPGVLPRVALFSLGLVESTSGIRRLAGSLLASPVLAVCVSRLAEVMHLRVCGRAFQGSIFFVRQACPTASHSRSRSASGFYYIE